LIESLLPFSLPKKLEKQEFQGSQVFFRPLRSDFCGGLFSFDVVSVFILID